MASQEARRKRNLATKEEKEGLDKTKKQKSQEGNDKSAKKDTQESSDNNKLTVIGPEEGVRT